MEDEIISSGAQSDQLTISSPISQEVSLVQQPPLTMVAPRHDTKYHVAAMMNKKARRESSEDRAFKKVKNNDIEKGLRNLTQTISEANRVHDTIMTSQARFKL